jgi:hypothetical protein
LDERMKMGGKNMQEGWKSGRMEKILVFPG